MADEAYHCLKDYHVEKPGDLRDWNNDDFNLIRSPNLRNIIIKYASQLKQGMPNSTSSRNKNQSQAEIFGQIHNVKRFFLYYVSQFHNNPKLILSVSYLDPKAISTAIKEIKENYSGDELLKEMEETYMAFAIPPEIKHVRLSRGILLYGPPGTGKTTLTYALPTRMGFLPMAPSIAAAEVNRPHVGETEMLLVDLLSRAHRFPHLICTLSVDEIDGLAPKRDDKSSQSKVDGLSVLLSYIGGIKDVPNLVFFGSTNRIKMMDTAFLRRLNAQFFVGKPGPLARRKMLARCQTTLNEQIGQVRLTEENMNNLTIWTTNFSGAALDSLVSELLVFAKHFLLPRKQTYFTDSQILNFIDKVSKQFNLSIGSTSLGMIFNELNLLKQQKLKLSADQMSMKFDSDFRYDSNKDGRQKEIECSKFVSLANELNTLHEKYTGLVIVDLKENTWILETKVGDYNEEIGNGPTNIKELLSECVSFASKAKLDSIQLFDLDLLLTNAAYDDTKATEIIQEKLDEIMKYSTSMAIIDLDSLVGLSENESMSNMGVSSSSSVGNMKLYSILLNIASKKQVISIKEYNEKPIEEEEFEDNNLSETINSTLVNKLPWKFDSDYFTKFLEKKLNNEIEERNTDHHFWVVIASANTFLLKRIFNECMTKQTESQEEKKRLEEEKSKKRFTCVLCKLDFTEPDNDKPNCNYHNGNLFCPSEKLVKQISELEVPKEAQSRFIIKQKELLVQQQSSTQGGSIAIDFCSELPNFKYLCCLNPYKHQGCRKGFHSTDENEWREIINGNYQKHQEKMMQLRL